MTKVTFTAVSLSCIEISTTFYLNPDHPMLFPTLVSCTLSFAAPEERPFCIADEQSISTSDYYTIKYINQINFFC